MDSRLGQIFMMIPEKLFTVAEPLQPTTSVMTVAELLQLTTSSQRKTSIFTIY